MRLVVALFLSIFMASNISIASDERKIYLEVDSTDVFQGEIYSFRLVAYPVENDFKEKIEKASVGKFINGLKIINVTNSKFSENNADAYVLEFEALVTADQIDSLIEDGEDSFSFDYRGGAVIPFNKPTNNLLLRDVTYELAKKYYLLIFLGISILFLLIFFVRKLMSRQQKIRLIKKQQEVWLSKLRVANTREEYDFLYRHRSQVLNTFNINHFDLGTLVATMEELQYKKNLSTEELSRIEQEFEKLRMQIR